MNYTTLMLAGLGVLGILMHNLIKLNSLNKAANGSLNFGQYLSLEKFAIMLSLCVIVVALIAQQEIKQFQQIGGYIGLAYVAIGYMAQSIVVTFMGRAAKFLDNEDKKNNTDDK